jgi:peptidoglycan hydrolase-like protein with peptidoglycan-binding domain
MVEASMRLRTSITAGLALLLTAGTAWSAPSAPGKAASKPAGKAARSSAKPAASPASKSRVKKSSRHSKRREPGQKAPAPERISEIQQALAKDGSFAGTPNGKWDDSTIDAMRKFQSGHGLNPSGKLDAPTLQKLGLGSQTAGIAAPMPPIATSSTTKAAQSAQRQ